MAVQQLYAALSAQRPALLRIKRWSLPFEILFAALALLIALCFALVCVGIFYPDIFGGVHVRVGPQGGELMLGEGAPHPVDSIDVGALPLASRLIGLIVMTGVLGSQIAAFYSLHKLFGGYRRGHVFAEASMRWMRRAACFLIAAGLAPLLFQPLVHAAGLRDGRWFQTHGLAFLLVGAALLVIAHIIALGREIEKEGEGYV